MKRRTAVLWLLALVLLFGGCTRDKEPVRKEIFSMDTHITITCYGKEAKEAADAAAAEIERLNHLWSIGFEDSEVSRINRGETKDLSAETEEILATALSLYQETEGALDITILPLMELWGFTTRTPAVPDPKDLDSALQNVGADRIILKDHKLELETGQGIDFGAIAKGPAQGQEALWRVGIRRPDDGAGYLGVLALTNKAVITSGGYERFFEENGQKYHHILDPKTGYPAQSGLVSVTIVSADGTLADGLSTACFVMGKERSISYWRDHADAFDMILMTEDGGLYITEPLEEVFDTEMTYEVISR